MFARRTYWTSILLLVLGVVFLTTGCGLFGGDDDDSTNNTGATVPSGGVGPSAEIGDSLGTVDGSPAEYNDALGTRPLVMVFYVPGNADDDTVIETINRLKTSFDRYTFLVYDYKDPDAYGTLAQYLGVGSLPFIAFVDAAGVLKEVSTGYIDEGSLNQRLVNLGKE